ncbi:rhodanese-like domain-containing protein [Balneatrix alpica]|uniref:Rhodanese-like domain-containing protein n=1 Tax=Balneatrix alpica TaxID=75684 RepID=A0ABV5ZA82_9GAMM|nr:rhodanese-like domain-containing protein [Balneatrix alpica]
MERFIEFTINHWELTSAFILTLAVWLWSEKKKGGASVNTSQATRLINREDAVILDIRARKDYSAGHIANSLNIAAAEVSNKLTELEKHKDKPIIVVCNLGQTAGATAAQLKKAGFTQVYRLSGGITEWKAANLPVVRS